MRNLKKILALVLALVMSFSVMTVSSAAFKDENKISANYAESVDVLSFIGVFRGDENGKFNPQKNITRAEVAAIIYRITTGDVEDAQAGFYADLNMFTDVKANDWFAGYVNYCASAEIIKGRGNGTFDPNGSITGYDALTMILRAIGRDKDGEFTGEGYTVKVAQIAKQCGITDTLKGVALGSPASREVIAEILLRTITVPQFSYTLAFGYSNYEDPMQKEIPTETLGYENFGLWYSGALRHDEWGVPYRLGWFIDANVDDTNADTLKATYKVCDAVEEYYSEYYVITTTELTPVYESKVAAYECDVAKALGLTKDLTIGTVTLNGTARNSFGDTDKYISFDGTINLVPDKKDYADIQEIGAQGRWTRIFKVGNAYEVVMMDEFLAMVADTTEVTYDRNGHVKAAATLTLYVFGQDQYGNLKTTVDVWTSNTNFDNVPGETMLIYKNANKYGAIQFNATTGAGFFEVIGAPTTLTGYQTAHTNKDSHVVENTEYADAIQFNFDEAGYETNAPHTWFFDTEGNLIAAMDVRAEDNTQYGVITGIKWVDENNTLSAGYALAAITFIDGTSTQMKINYINGNKLYDVGSNYGTYPAGVSQNLNYNNKFLLHTLYSIKTTNRGVELEKTTPVADAYTNTGVSQLGKTDWYADTETLFLVQTYDAYGRVVFETYTGINEIPSYAKNAKNPEQYWVVDLDKGNHNVAEYVYIVNPSLYGYDDEMVTTFFSYEDSKLTVYKTLYNDDLYLYTVYGGMVNGEEGSFSTFDSAIVDYVMDNQGILLVLDYVIDFPSEFEYVVGASRVIDVELANVPAYKQYTIYGGDAADARIENGVLFTIVDGVKLAYNLGDVVVVDEYNRSLKTVLAAAQTPAYGEEAYLYITYNKSGSSKNALTIYVSTVEGYTNSELTANVAMYQAEVEMLTAELKLATAALEALQGPAPAAYFEKDYKDMDEVELLEAIDVLKEQLLNAVALLEMAIEYADAEAVIDTESVNKTVVAAGEAVMAVSAPVTIAVEAVEVVYTVEDDAKAIVVKATAAVKDAAEKDPAVAELIALGATVTVTTKAAEIADEVVFVVTITCGETVVEYELTIAVTAKLEEKAAE